MSERTLIASDLDEVLGQFLKSFLKHYNTHNNTFHEFHEFNSYDFTTILKRPYNEIQVEVKAYFNSDEFKHHYEPLPGAIDGFNELLELYDINVVTARPLYTEKDTSNWLQTHFDQFHASHLHMGNHHGEEGERRKKSQICKEINAQVLIDDCLEYALDCSEHGIDVVLFDWEGKYGWNKLHPSAPVTELPENIKRVTNWNEALDAVGDFLNNSK
jgi:5'(3')-deoxyribonucleotidase